MEKSSSEVSGRAKLSSMEGYVAKTYGERIAPIYDERYPNAAPGQVNLLALIIHADRQMAEDGHCAHVVDLDFRVRV
jgi:hypothetical protein